VNVATRIDGRAPDQLRSVTFEPGYLTFADGSVLISVGNTRVICAATIEERVPPWMRGRGTGWVTAEYAMLPQATPERNQREAVKGRLGGRTHEIQRLVGRALRSVVDLAKLGERSVIVDCDVIGADGGTRTAAITGAWVALALALRKHFDPQQKQKWPLSGQIAAVSVGIVDGTPVLDLPYDEDSRAEVDMNVAMTDAGGFVEVQGTAEREPFTRAQLDGLLELAEGGIRQLFAAQARALEAAPSLRPAQGETAAAAPR
jgi:ribonuclease PH